MSQKTQVGIQFKANSLRLAAIKNDNAPILTLTETVDLVGGVNESGLFIDPKKTIDSLRSWVTENRLTGMPAVFSVPNNSAFISWTKLPEVTGQELLSVARYRLRKQFPKMHDHAVVAVAQPNGQQEESLAIGVDRELIEQRAEIIEQSGLIPLAAEVEAQAMLRVVDHFVRSGGHFDPNANYCIVQISSDRTHFVVIRSGKLSFMRTVRVGSLKIEELVAKSLNLTTETVGEVLYNPNTWLFNRQHVSSINGDFDPIDIGEPIDALVKEFRLLINFFRSLHAERSYTGVINHLIVLGKINQLRGFTTSLSDLLSVPMQSFNPLIGVGIDLPANQYESTVSQASQFTVALGLAQAPYQEFQTQENQNESEFRFIGQAV